VKYEYIGQNVGKSKKSLCFCMAALCNKIATETMQSIHPMVFLILTEGSETTLRNPKVPASDFDQYTVYSID